MSQADFRIITEATAQRIAEALEALNPGSAGSVKAGTMGPAAYLNNGLILEATQALAGLMSASDKSKLDAAEALVFTAGKALTQNAGFHNSLFRGKSLGTSVTAAQWAAIGAGTFDDLFIGDYWTINGIVWRIAAFRAGRGGRGRGGGAAGAGALRAGGFAQFCNKFGFFSGNLCVWKSKIISRNTGLQQSSLGTPKNLPDSY